MLTLNIIGCGKVGKTLGRLWIKHDLVSIGDVANRTLESAEKAVAFLGRGRAVARVQDMRPADIYFIATTDDNISEAARQLANCGLIRSSDTVFHCSGALSSSVLSPLRSSGAFLGSVHPAKSFADPRDAVSTFAGTFCAVEGDPQAQTVLTQLLTEIGGQVFHIDPEHKIIYHAATVFVCNYLTALLELGRRSCLKAGLDETTAMRLMEPLVQETVANVFRRGPAQALTGPVARGDEKLVAGQLAALTAWQPETGEIYRLLGKVALDLARQENTASPKALDNIQRSLKKR